MTMTHRAPDGGGDICAPALKALRAALPSVLVALDFDGTLAPLAPHPAGARPLPGTGQILHELRATEATVAIITGRTVASLLGISRFGTVPGIIIYGTHGAERWQDGQLRSLPPPPGLPGLRLELPGLVSRLTRDPAVWIEDKGLSLVIHTRLTTEPDRLLGMLHDTVTEIAAGAGLGVRPGREVLEICIPGIDKGTAIRELISHDTAAALYAGDDLGDLPAIKEVNAWAGRTGRPKLTIAVSPDETSPVAMQADLTVPDPQSLLPLLRQITLDVTPGRRP